MMLVSTEMYYKNDDGFLENRHQKTSSSDKPELQKPDL